MRGNRRQSALDGHAPGSIPACAGEPHTHRRPARIGEVYPRVCGGTGAGGGIRRRRAGLSPRVRGNLLAFLAKQSSTWSIPACAGEPKNPRVHETTSTVYPRVCGGTLPTLDWLVSNQGLSPRVRGNRKSVESCASSCRSIPACAGEPQSRLRYFPEWGVYPRVCGGTDMF